MASKKYEDAHAHQNDVKVHHQKAGCPIDQRRDQHTHTQPDWREAVDNAGERSGR